MTRILIAVATLSLALPLTGVAQPTMQAANMSMPMSGHELHSLMKSAHSSAQYKQIADYFHQSEAKYRAEAAAEKIEVDRRAQVNAGLYQKYPRPVDSAQHLYEAYLADADSAAAQAKHYDQLAAGQTQHEVETATGSQGKL
jgi:hypothetical protein